MPGRLRRSRAGPASGGNTAPQRRPLGAGLTSHLPGSSSRDRFGRKKMAVDCGVGGRCHWCGAWGHSDISGPFSIGRIMLNVCPGSWEIKPYSPSRSAPWPPEFSPSAAVLASRRWRWACRITGGRDPGRPCQVRSVPRAGSWRRRCGSRLPWAPGARSGV